MCPQPRCSPLYHDQVQSPEYPHGDGSCAQPCDCGKNVGFPPPLAVHPCVWGDVPPIIVTLTLRAQSPDFAEHWGCLLAHPRPPPRSLFCCWGHLCGCRLSVHRVHFVAQPCGEYLWDFRAINVSINGQTLLDWYVNSWAMNANSANGSNPYVDGTFFVCVRSKRGPLCYHGCAIEALGCSQLPYLS